MYTKKTSLNTRVQPSKKKDRSVCYEVIIPQTETLSQLIANRELTNILDQLERQGFIGDSAVFLIACLQKSGGAR
jgi:hypothetical protein